MSKNHDSNSYNIFAEPTGLHKFTYGKYRYNYYLIKQERKTINLTVCPDKTILLKCPIRTKPTEIDQFLKRKWIWLEDQLEFFTKFNSKTNYKEYKTGESFYYLGRQYKLCIKRGNKEEVLLQKNRLVLYTTKALTDIQHNNKMLTEWFDSLSKIVFTERFNEVLKRFNYKHPPQLKIRTMKKRWGSYLSKGNILLNPKLIHVSRSCIDYVITHELCHLRYRNHNQNFFKLLSLKYPGWKKIKDKLEMYKI